MGVVIENTSSTCFVLWIINNLSVYYALRIYNWTFFRLEVKKNVRSFAIYIFELWLTIQKPKILLYRILLYAESLETYKNLLSEIIGSKIFVSKSN